MKEHDPYQALRVPAYRHYFIGAILASVGAEMQAMAVGWELYRRTGSYAYLGYTGLVQFLPVLLLALPAGQAADRYNRRKMFQCGQAVAASAALALAWLSGTNGPIAGIFACLAVSGVGRAISAPSRSSLLAQIVPRDLLPSAVAWNSTAWQLANVSGPALGGLLLAGSRLLGADQPEMVAYIGAGCCAIGCLTLLFLVHPQRPVGAPPPQRNLQSVLAGIRFVWSNNLLLAAISLDLFAVLLGGATALLPAYAKDILKVDEVAFGILRAAPAMGAASMAFFLAIRPPLRRPGLSLLLAVAGFGVATIIFGISRSYPLSFVMLFLTGALDNISVVVRGTLMQVLTPDDMRGRVAAVNSLFISSSNELGAYESGQVAAWFGPIFSVVSGGVGTVLVVVTTAILCPALVRLGSLHRLSPSSNQNEPNAT